MVILDIINEINSTSTKDLFLNGYCYDFAYMLQRTLGGDICYSEHLHHYFLRVDGVCYDVTGEIKTPTDLELDK